MKCSVCKIEEASVFLKKIINGQSQSINLCQSCADDLGVVDSNNITLFDQIFDKNLDKPQELFCENCGFTQSDLKRTARLGCSMCYGKFEKEINKMIEVMHKSTVHLGKVPINYDKKVDSRKVIEDLNKKLKEAITEERFEEAALLRDKIHKLSID